MKLVFKNDNDIYKFYHFFWLYKLGIKWFKLEAEFNNTKLKLECSEIIDAYNIKNKTKRLSYIYDIASKRLDDLVKINNYCAFCNNHCLVQKNRAANNGCCGNCKYLTKNGCSIVSLACKLYYCFKIRKIKKCPKLKDVIILKLFLSPFQIFKLKMCLFETKNDTLKQINNSEIIWF